MGTLKRNIIFGFILLANILFALQSIIAQIMITKGKGELLSQSSVGVLVDGSILFWSIFLPFFIKPLKPLFFTYFRVICFLLLVYAALNIFLPHSIYFGSTGSINLKRYILLGNLETLTMLGIGAGISLFIISLNFLFSYEKPYYVIASLLIFLTGTFLLISLVQSSVWAILFYFIIGGILFIFATKRNSLEMTGKEVTN